jgi:ABC-type transport system involved in multi-copper enzyme maturation permease subunit
MNQLVRAEYKKIVGNRRLMMCMIYIWPMVACAVGCMLTLNFAINASARETYSDGPFTWTEMALIPWFLLNNPIGRLLLIGFPVTVFAGEYENRTWKTVVPGNPRWRLMIAKYLAMSGFIVAAFTVMSIFLVIAVGLMNTAFGADYPPAITGDVLTEFVRDYALNATMAFVAMLVVGALGILISIITRSILMGVFAGMVVSGVEFLGIPLILALTAAILQQDTILDLIVLTPSYNTDNIIAWINFDTPTEYFSEDITSLSLSESVMMLTGWVVGLVGLSILVFQRQDIQ